MVRPGGRSGEVVLSVRLGHVHDSLASHMVLVTPHESDPSLAIKGWFRFVLPSVGDLAFVTTLTVAAMFGTTLMSRDGDVGTHIAWGRWMLEHGAIVRMDIFTTAHEGLELVARNWLTQVAFAWLDAEWSLLGVGFAGAAAIALPWAITTRRLAVKGISPTGGCLIAFGVLGSMIHWAIRPHVISWSFLAGFAWALDSYESGRRRHVWWLVPLMALWVNLHGGFVVGFLVIGAHLLSAVIRKAPVAHLVRVGAFCGAATLISPFGWDMVGNLLHYFQQGYMWEFTAEFQSPNFHNPLTWPFLFVLLYALVRVRGVTNTILVVGFGALALYSLRNIPLFLLVAIPAVAPVARERDSGWIAFNQKAAGGALSIAAIAFFALTGFGSFGFDDRFPHAVAEIDPPGSTVFHPIEWGGYLLYCCPGIRPFTDAQTDLYGEEFLREFDEVTKAEGPWQETLDRYEVDWLLLDPDMVLAKVARHEGWRVLSESETVVILVPDT